MWQGWRKEFLSSPRTIVVLKSLSRGLWASFCILQCCFTPLSGRAQKCQVHYLFHASPISSPSSGPLLPLATSVYLEPQERNEACHGPEISLLRFWVRPDEPKECSNLPPVPDQTAHASMSGIIHSKLKEIRRNLAWQFSSVQPTFSRSCRGLHSICLADIIKGVQINMGSKWLSKDRG